MSFVLAVHWLCVLITHSAISQGFALQALLVFLKEHQAGPSPESPHTHPSQELHCSRRWAELPLSSPKSS